MGRAPISARWANSGATVRMAVLRRPEPSVPRSVDEAGLFREVGDRHATDRVLKVAAGRLDPVVTIDAELAAAGPGSAVTRSVAGITELLERAQAAGAIRADVTLTDLALLLGSVPRPEVPAAMRDRFVDVVIAGLTYARRP